MTALEIFYSILALIAGLGVFLYGMKVMGDSLENVAGNRIKKLFAKISSNKLVGVGVGTVTTAVIQSSSAVTVMLIGFVNAGLMELNQIPSIILGANIGTTITAQLVAFGFGGIQNFKVALLLSSLTGIGALMIMLSKKDKVKKVGLVFVGLGMLFVGLELMSSAMAEVGQASSSFFANVTHPLLLLLIGILFTAVIQSSSAASSIFITMAVAGMLTLDQSVYLIIGSNVGTCITAIIASIGTNVNARRTALIHLTIKILGAFIFMLIVPFVPFADWIESAFSQSIALQVAMVHTIFNVATTLLLLPFTSLIVKFAVKVIPDKKPKVDKNAPHLYYIESHFLSTPPIAVEQVKREVINMSDIARKNLDMSINGFLKLDNSKTKEIMKREAELDYLSKEIPKFIVKLTNEDISYKDKKVLGSYYHVVADLERIGDYAENITEYTDTAISENAILSEHAQKEIVDMVKSVNKVYDLAMTIFTTVNPTLTKELNYHEEEVDRLKEVMAYKHIERLKKERCSAESGALYLNISSDLERVADHMCNVSDSIKNYASVKNIKKTYANKKVN